MSTDLRIFGPFPYYSATSDADQLRLRPRGLAPLGDIIVTSRRWAQQPERGVVGL